MEQEIIRSTDNEKIKYLKKLQNKKTRNEDDLFFVESLSTIYDSMGFGILPMELFIREDLLNKNNEKVNLILSKIENFYIMNKKVNDYISALTTSSGIYAVFNKINKGINFDSNIVYLNGINDPGNMGTILRTSLAFGFNNIVVDDACVDIYNPKVINASKDSIFKLNVSFDKDLEVFGNIKKQMKVYSTVMEGGVLPEKIKDLASPKRSLGYAKESKKYCIVFGNEANGISQKILDKSDGNISLSIDKIESLNVAISAGIILYELRKL